MADAIDRPIFDAELCAILGIGLTTLKRGLRNHSFPLAPLPSIDKRRRWSRTEVARYLAGETRTSGRRRAS